MRKAAAEPFTLFRSVQRAVGHFKNAAAPGLACLPAWPEDVRMETQWSTANVFGSRSLSVNSTPQPQTQTQTHRGGVGIVMDNETNTKCIAQARPSTASAFQKPSPP